MKNIDDLVVKRYFWDSSKTKTFKEQREAYEKLTKQIETVKKKYDDLLNKASSEDAMSFKDKVDLYNSVKSDNYALKDKLLDMYDDLREYVELYHYLRELRDRREEIISENISFQNFGGDEYFDERCISTSHCLIKIDEDIFCAYCGATSKDYALSKEDFYFLIHCAECKGIFLKDVTKDDLPLLRVLIEKNNYYRSQRTPLDEFDEENYLTMAEEYWLSNESEIPEIRRKIRKAHILDTKKYLDRTGLNEEDAKKSYIQLVQEWKIDDVAVSNPDYLTGERLKELQTCLAVKFASLEELTGDDKDLVLEECMTYKYELLILSGTPIPDLLRETTTELEKATLTKAYLNISSSTYRKNSGYFRNENDAIFYDCITANPEINQRILAMKKTCS